MDQSVLVVKPQADRIVCRMQWSSGRRLPTCHGGACQPRSSVVVGAEISKDGGRTMADPGADYTQWDRHEPPASDAVANVTTSTF